MILADYVNSFSNLGNIVRSLYAINPKSSNIRITFEGSVEYQSNFYNRVYTVDLRPLNKKSKFRETEISVSVSSPTLLESDKKILDPVLIEFDIVPKEVKGKNVAPLVPEFGKSTCNMTLYDLDFVFRSLSQYIDKYSSARMTVVLNLINSVLINSVFYDRKYRFLIEVEKDRVTSGGYCSSHVEVIAERVHDLEEGYLSLKVDDYNCLWQHISQAKKNMTR